MQKIVIFGLLTGTLFIGLSVFIFLNSMVVFEYSMRYSTQLKQGSAAMSMWETSNQTKLKIYIFNVENPEEILKGEKPIMKELGPYTFWEHQRKKIIDYSKDSSKLKYSLEKKYLFDPVQSNGSLDDLITVINPLIVTMSSFIEKISKSLIIFGPILSGTLNTIFNIYESNLFVVETVRQFLFEGEKLNSLDTLMLMIKPFEAIGIIDVPKSLSDNQFSLLNKTNADVYVIYTGTSGTSENYSNIAALNGKSFLTYWKSDECNKIVGSDGFQFPPFVDKNTTLHYFKAEFCRSISATYKNESEVLGITTLRFMPSENTFYGLYSNPENKCYCLASEGSRQCFIDGIIPISPCWSEIPAFLSNPHFLAASKSLQDKIIGLDPNPSKHSSYFDVEPSSGYVLYNANRYQINIRLHRINSVRSIDKVIPENFVPLVWIEELTEIDEHSLEYLRQTLSESTNYSIISIGGSSTIGLLIISVCLLFIVINAKKVSKKDGDDESIIKKSNMGSLNEMSENFPVKSAFDPSQILPPKAFYHMPEKITSSSEHVDNEIPSMTKEKKIISPNQIYSIKFNEQSSAPNESKTSLAIPKWFVIDVEEEEEACDSIKNQTLQKTIISPSILNEIKNQNKIHSKPSLEVKEIAENILPSRNSVIKSPSQIISNKLQNDKLDEDEADNDGDEDEEVDDIEANALESGINDFDD